MALADFVAVQSGPLPFSAVSRRLRNWRNARRAERQQRLALQSLLFMPQHRLRDLGISRDQLVQAMEIHRK
jgi:uncharacterized protein YjiS (DUF1127 family)